MSSFPIWGNAWTSWGLWVFGLRPAGDGTASCGRLRCTSHKQTRQNAATRRTRRAVGDWIYTNSHRLSNKTQDFNGNLGQSSAGPYQVLEKISRVVYWVLKNGVRQKIQGSAMIPALPRTIPAELAGEQPQARKHTPAMDESQRSSTNAYSGFWHYSDWRWSYPGEASWGRWPYP